MKDIFVDNNIAQNFARAKDPHYKKFCVWLYNIGSLVVSNKLINEYKSSNRNCCSQLGIASIIDAQTRDGRLNKIENNQLRQFRFQQNIERSFRSNRKDHEFIKLVLLSFRKLGLTIDQNLAYDIKHYPRYSCKISSRPERIPYL